jgi:protein ImuB
MTNIPPADVPRLRSLNRPRAAKVEADASGEPAVLLVSGRRIMVETVLDRWRIEDEWWRERPVSRMYYRVVLEDGRVVELYRALLSGRWYRQTY